jgi:hypothetical protein
LDIRKNFEAYLETRKSYENKIIEDLFWENNEKEQVLTIEFNWENIDLKTNNLLWSVWNYLPQEWILLSKINEILSNKKEKKNKYKLIINIEKNEKSRNFIKSIYLQLV